MQSIIQHPTAAYLVAIVMMYWCLIVVYGELLYILFIRYFSLLLTVDILKVQLIIRLHHCEIEQNSLIITWQQPYHILTC